MRRPDTSAWNLRAERVAVATDASAIDVFGTFRFVAVASAAQRCG